MEIARVTEFLWDTLRARDVSHPSVVVPPNSSNIITLTVLTPNQSQMANWILYTF